MMHDSESDNFRIREYLRKREETAIDKLRRQTQASLRRFWHVLRYALILAPLLITAILLLDLPLRLYDGLAGGQDSISPSNWLSWGEGLLVFSIAFLACIARCHGADHAARVATLAWIIAAIVISGLLFYIAPQLGPGDLPGGRYMIGLFCSWYIGQIIAVHIYDVTRGGRWWRAPFYGLVFGFGVQGLIYFPVVYGLNGQMDNVPWISWMIIDFCIKAGLALAFLPVYRSLKRSLRPHLGLGGA